MRGSRVKNIVRELNNEKVDIIRWSADVKEFVLEALKPAKVKSVTLEEARKAILIKVDEDQLSLAIGKRGQNARLTSRLTGWDINIEKDESAAEVFEARVVKAAGVLVSALAIDQPTAVALVKGGLANLDTLVEVEAQDIADALGIELDRATEIHAAAKQAHEKNMASTQ
jgi:N utilization substance protein A